MPKKVAVRLSKVSKQRTHLKDTETQPAQPEETIKPEPSESFSGSLNAASSTSKGSVKSEGVEKPSFVLADWVTRFLPTLYHVLFCSETPFHEFSKGSMFADTVQKVLDVVHPGNTYIVTTQCKIYSTVRYHLFLCTIHSLITPFKRRHMIGSLKNGLISAHTLYIWLKCFSNSTNSRTTPSQ